MNKKRRVILYVSHGGSTEQYAHWIADDCHATCINIVDGYSAEMIRAYDTVILGSYVKMGKVYMQEFLIDHFADLKSKDLFMFTVGLVPLTSPDGQRSWNRIPAYIRDHILYHEKFTGQINRHTIAVWERVIIALGGISMHDTITRHQIARFVAEICRDDARHI